ncbi:MAG: hypothetical protein CMJ18_10925 [Phycisphaeraceae bacterium]|nr:hypothetical protein [Phycisphaeraceae bacterium]
MALLLAIGSSARADVFETFEGLGPTTGGWGGNANWTFDLDSGNPYRANRWRGDVTRALDIVDAGATFTTPSTVTNPNASTTIGNGPSAAGNRVIGSGDIATQGRGMVYRSGNALSDFSFDWRGLGPSSWAVFGNASGRAFGFRVTSQNVEVNTFGNGSEIAYSGASGPAVIQDNSDTNKTGWFALDISIDNSPYSAPSGLSAPASFTVSHTPAGGSTTALTQEGSGSPIGVHPLDFNETSFPVITNQTYDGGPIDTIWLFEEPGRHETVPGASDPAGVWDNFLPEPGTGLILGIATMLVGFRRR